MSVLADGFSRALCRYLPVSFNQAIGATTPFFTAVLAFLLQVRASVHRTSGRSHTCCRCVLHPRRHTDQPNRFGKQVCRSRWAVFVSGRVLVHCTRACAIISLDGKPSLLPTLPQHLQGSREGICTYLALLPVMGGVVVASGGEPMFHILGFTFCMLATVGSRQQQRTPCNQHWWLHRQPVLPRLSFVQIAVTYGAHIGSARQCSAVLVKAIGS